MNAIERRVWLGFAAVGIASLVIGWLVYANTDRLKDDQQAVSQSHQMLDAIDSALSSLQDVESGHRGYLLTADPRFLKPYTAGIEAVNQKLDYLQTLYRRDPLQVQRLASLEALAAEEAGFARQAIAIRDTEGDEAAHRFVASGRGEAVMDDAREVVAAMKLTEEDRLGGRASVSDETTRNTLMLTGGLAALSLGLFAILLVAITRALTNQRRAAEADARMSAIVGASSDAIISLDLEGRISSWNAAAEHIFGYPADEAAGRHISLIAPPDYANVQATNLQAVRAGDKVTGQETLRIAKDGRRIYVSLSAFPLRNNSGDITGIGGVFRDITERKQAEEALRDSERRWGAVFQASPAAISIVRLSDLAILDINESWLDMFELDREAVIGRTALEIGIWADPSGRPALLDRARTENSARDVELSWRTSSGRIIDTITSWDQLQFGGESCLINVAVDVTERKQAERDLRESERRWATIFNYSPVGISITRASDGVILDVNTRILDMFGATREEVVGRTSLDLGNWADLATRATVAEALAVAGSMHDIETQWRAKSGRILDTISSWNLLDLEGEPCILTLITDITDRVEAERDRERVFSLSTNLIAVAGFDGRLRRVNPAAVDALGYSEEELLAIPFLDLLHEDDREAGVAAVARLASGVRSVTLQGRLGKRDGTYLRAEIAASAEPGENTLYIVTHDVTARWELEKALRAGEERFRSVIETATDAIVITDDLGNIEVFNHAAELVFGYAASEVIGENTRIFIPSPENDAHDGHIAAFHAAGTSEVLGMRRELLGRRKDGTVFPFDLTVNAMRVGDQLKFAAIMRDTTARKELETELREAKDAAEEANRAKSAFLSRMSHELRTPLNVVLGFGQVLQLDPLDAQQTEAVDYILKAGRHLLELIDEVLDLSRIESGRLSLSIEPVRLDELLTDTLMLVRPLATQRGITVHADLDSCTAYALADRQRTKEVLLNLLANAIKYNREGGRVDISCEHRESVLRVKVTDTGPGIPAEKIHRLFSPFDRLGAEATGVEGTGLGLALSKTLVEAMGGTIGVESTVGMGSTFWVELALTEEPSPPDEEGSSEPRADRPPLTGQRTVLYIEDNLANLSLMERVLVGRLGFRLLSAMQGSIGYNLATDHHPDLIFLDIHLPDMPGSAVLDRLQDNPATRHIPVVIVSADATPGQIARLRAAGARAYITKPFELKELFEVIDSLQLGVD